MERHSRCHALQEETDVYTEQQVSIGAPTDVVWAVMRDVRGWSEWTGSITAVEALHHGSLEVGARFRVRSRGCPRPCGR
jgi:uncharacterized membrane protein